MKVDEAWSNIDVQLQRRAELIPNLLNTVKGAAKFEQETMTQVTAMRTIAQKLSAASKEQDAEAAAQANEELSVSLRVFFATVESYPELRATANFSELQRTLENTANQMSYVQQDYNDTVKRLNSAMITVPTSFFVGFAKVVSRKFFQADSESRKNPVVEF